MRRYSLSSVHSDKKWSWKRTEEKKTHCECVYVWVRASSLELPPSFCALVENLVHTRGSCVSTLPNPYPSPILHSLLFYYVKTRAWDGGFRNNFLNSPPTPPSPTLTRSTHTHTSHTSEFQSLKPWKDCHTQRVPVTSNSASDTPQ